MRSPATPFSDHRDVPRIGAASEFHSAGERFTLYAMKWDWRKKKTWDALALVLTLGWLIFIAAETQGDLNHPMANLMFIVPIGIWGVVIAIKRLLLRD